jgi:tetratricopeptide (TPR) repeat protein
MATKSYHSIALFLLLLVLTAVSAVAQIAALPPSATNTGLGGNNSIVGTILGPSGQPVNGRIRIKLATMTVGDRVTMTDDGGNFAFRGLPAGNYTVVIDKEKEFEPVIQAIDIIQFRGAPGQSYTVNIRLEPRKDALSKPGVINSELANVPKSARAFYVKGIELAKAGNAQGAIEQFTRAIAEFPRFVLAYNELGVQYLRMNDLVKAEESLRSALKIESRAYEPLINLGLVLVAGRKFEEAEPVLRNAIKAKDAPVGHYFLGQAVANLGRFDEAEKELLIAVKLGGDEMKEAHRFLAIIYNAKGDRKLELNELEAYLKLSPNAPDAENFRNRIRKIKESDVNGAVPNPKQQP